MKDKQRGIYNDFSHQEHDGASAKIIIEPKKNKSIIKNILKKLLTSYKGLAALSIGIVVVWNFAGQIILQPEYRFSTFLGNRIGDVETAQSKTSLPQEAHKTSVIASEQAQVEVDKNCTIQRNNNALQAVYQCLADGGTEYLCDFRRREMLKQACNSFVSNELDKSSQNPSQ
ncbi:MAG: hypothetical protein WBK77_08030 [Alphaproteobacteria bacterium]